MKIHMIQRGQNMKLFILNVLKLLRIIINILMVMVQKRGIMLLQSIGGEILSIFLIRRGGEQMQRRRADAKVKRAIEKGCTNVSRLDFKPHYFSTLVWEKLDKYWRSNVFEKRSDAGRMAREKVEITARTGAKPYSQKWEEMEEKKNEPLTALEFASAVYKFDKPGEQEFKDKLTRVQSSQPDQLVLEALEALSPEQASSPKSQKKIHRKELLNIVQARPPKKGKTVLYPWHTVAEFIGAQGAAELIAS